jgi:hypothetical protein
MQESLVDEMLFVVKRLFQYQSEIQELIFMLVVVH